MAMVVLYKLCAFVLGVVVVSTIDILMGIKLENCPFWKRVVHVTMYMTLGAIGYILVTI